MFSCSVYSCLTHQFMKRTCFCRAARFISKYKPHVPIVCVLGDPQIARTLQLCRGLVPVVVHGKYRQKGPHRNTFHDCVIVYENAIE